MVICATLAVRSAHAQLDVATVVERAGAYVENYWRELGSIVSEERYEQKIRPAKTSRRLKPSSGSTETKLRSEFLLVRAPEIGWIPFRDVLERDGQPVRIGEERLTTLFASRASDARERIRAILLESAKYNIGNVDRNINVPTLALPILTGATRKRFTFTEGKPDGAARGRVIDFKEVMRPTLITGNKGRDLPLFGRFWIDEATGTVTRSEVRAEDTLLEAQVTVTYKMEKSVGAWVPIRMEERYKGRRDPLEITGVATYSNFRRFVIETAGIDPK